MQKQSTGGSQPVQTCSYHASLSEDVAPPRVHWGALTGVSIAKTAASHHHVVESVIIFILRVSALPAQQGVAKGEEAAEVHADVCHQDQIWSFVWLDRANSEADATRWDKRIDQWTCV